MFDGGANGRFLSASNYEGLNYVTLCNTKVGRLLAGFLGFPLQKHDIENTERWQEISVLCCGAINQRLQGIVQMYSMSINSCKKKNKKIVAQDYSKSVHRPRFGWLRGWCLLGPGN